MGVLELIEQTANRLRFFKRIEILALDVFDQGHGQCILVGDIAQHHRHLVESGQLGRPKATLAGDDLVAVGSQGAYDDRLHQSVLADRCGKFLQRAFVHAGARLIAPGLQLVERQCRWRPDASGSDVGRWLEALAEQVFEAAAEAFWFFRNHAEKGSG